MTIYTRHEPFTATLRERTLLTPKEAEKRTYHIVLDLKGSGILYKPGDSLGILPENPPETVERTLLFLEETTEEGKKLLTKEKNITAASKKLALYLIERMPSSDKKRHLEEILHHKETCKTYLEPRFVSDLFEETGVRLKESELLPLLQPLLPRFYSIASSQKAVGDEVHLTVALVSYMHKGEERRGVGSHFLAESGVDKVRLYIQSAPHFKLPEDPSIPIIMVGPGTGIAPFRGFLQERIFNKTSGKNWLVFGEKHRNTHFYYQSEWEDLEKKGLLDLDLAFSRDQDKKIYVQDRLYEKRDKLFSWLENGAYLYVCGDAKRMAKDVEAKLHAILEEAGGLTHLEAGQYIGNLRKEKRYLRDVY